ncbi:MAG: hypothetical protein V1875_04760 [Candidatus Altiarchaeota archaeon]
MTLWLSRYQAQEILAAAKKGANEADISVDLGLTESTLRIEADSVIFPDGQMLPLRILEKISKGPVCTIVECGSAYRIQFFRKETNKVYRLVATGKDTPPTAELGGFRMHRTKGTDPAKDTESKIAAIKPVRGSRVLDTCTGLGYTAIAAVDAGADEVHTFEADEGMVNLREANPWSMRLQDGRIRKVLGDVSAGLGGFADGFFDSVIHDPPSMNIAGELYSLEFYSQLHRVMRGGGRLFHYVGAPRTKYRGLNPVVGVMRRLRDAGFSRIARKADALGVTALR